MQRVGQGATGPIWLWHLTFARESGKSLIVKLHREDHPTCLTRQESGWQHSMMRLKNSKKASFRDVGKISKNVDLLLFRVIPVAVVAYGGLWVGIEVLREKIHTLNVPVFDQRQLVLIRNALSNTAADVANADKLSLAEFIKDPELLNSLLPTPESVLKDVPCPVAQRHAEFHFVVRPTGQIPISVIPLSRSVVRTGATRLCS